MPRTYRFVIVDVFTDTPFTGNQLGVFTNATGLSDDEMLMLARELHFSETTFVLPPEADGDVRMRIFTPVRELPFAGHPTLGTAFVLGGPLQKVIIKLETARGTVPVSLDREGAEIVFGRMEQPIPTIEPYADPAPLFAALGVSGSLLPVERYDNGTPHVYVMVDSEAEVVALKPDIAALATLVGPTGVSVFAVDGARVKARMFGPELGVIEDPATGSAAGPLAVHLARHGLIAWGDEITIAQGAEVNRPSTLFAHAEGDSDTITRVEVGGSARVVARGEFSL
ncbi:MAG: PhzF family phenazine biosynthesis protein [Coriobacteriia bacterium]|nr:PhzF family phenazine biosynthesis protein [Coriobacteriia bacterium]